ncbi:hypothetical protein DERP_010407 [Dermatophagoides pteronyssinus]|uniref:Uncharacterized protein n=1 Tax=Dermatophagoides pteronyssinus TaxID=6956 RepID=A0ABQ8J4T1_DERPT|nr:hypothetical protein DERP_010407 [Dermatophagoides pteronyssinus]
MIHEEPGYRIKFLIIHQNEKKQVKKKKSKVFVNCHQTEDNWEKKYFDMMAPSQFKLDRRLK